MNKPAFWHEKLLTQVTNRVNTCTNNSTRANLSLAEKAESGIHN